MPRKQQASDQQLKHSAKVLINARTTSGISQRELSSRINVTQPLVSSWEKGKTIPSLHHIVAIETALNAEQGSLLLAIAYGAS